MTEPKAGPEGLDTRTPTATSSAKRTSTGVTRKAKAAVDSGAAKIRAGRSVAQDYVASAADRGAAVIEDNPLALLAGAIAVGAIAAAAIPATERELDAAGPIGQRLKSTIDGAIKTAKAAGVDHFTSSELFSATAGGGLGGIIGGVVKAVMSAAGQDETGTATRSQTARNREGVPADAAA